MTREGRHICAQIRLERGNEILATGSPVTAVVYTTVGDRPLRTIDYLKIGAERIQCLGSSPQQKVCQSCWHSLGMVSTGGRCNGPRGVVSPGGRICGAG